MVAIKRLDHLHDQDQGIPEFLKEITTLPHYKHENLISLLVFCYEGGEVILVYQLASHGSLDKHLNSPDLTWSKRIKICLDAAKGLRHLHDPRETHQRLIHCDVKGGNILLDDQWSAKVADFGFSIMGPANELYSSVINLAAGTPGYCDPQYAMTHNLTKESDVYSFGVVLVEVFCGALCYTYSNGSVQFNLVPTWIKRYEQQMLNDIIFKCPTIHPLHQSALEIFSDIAHQCLEETLEDRPEMTEIVTQLVTALECQELFESQEFNAEWNTQGVYYKAISKCAEPPLSYRSKVELMTLLSKGVLLNGGKTWFSLNKKGEHCEMISFAECTGSKLNRRTLSNETSRFVASAYILGHRKIKIRVKTQFLSPGITYTVNFVFKSVSMNVVDLPTMRNGQLLSLKYKLKGRQIVQLHTSHMIEKMDGGWLNCFNLLVTAEFLIFESCLKNSALILL